MTIAEYQAQTAATRPERLAWWQAARFGMFIHWGLYSHAPFDHFHTQVVNYEAPYFQGVSALGAKLLAELALTSSCVAM